MALTKQQVNNFISHVQCSFVSLFDKLNVQISYGKTDRCKIREIFFLKALLEILLRTAPVDANNENLGDELMFNGDFSDGVTGYTAGAGWAEGTNNIIATASSANLTLPITLVQNKKYRLSITVTSYTAGTLTPVIAALGNGTSISSNGIHTQIINGEDFTTATSAILLLGASFSGTVDDISIKEIKSTATTECLTTAQIQSIIDYVNSKTDYEL